MNETKTDVAQSIDVLPGTELLPDLKHDIRSPYEGNRSNRQQLRYFLR